MLNMPNLLSKLKFNPANPRTISAEDFKRLKTSIKNFPKMLELRPIVYDEAFVVQGGNMRLKALKELIKDGFEIKPEYFKEAKDLTPEELREFAIKDNVPAGDWDYDVLANEWGDLPLEEWGIEMDFGKEEFYSRKIVTPTYEPSNEKPDLKTLVDKTTAEKLLKEIEASDLPEEEKDFLRLASYRHVIFDYAKVADYYANSDERVKKLMENSGLVIIDFKKAIEMGYVALTEGLMEIEGEDYGE